MLCDSHVHIGRFRELYFDPVETAENLLSAGVEKWAVSSTTIALGKKYFRETIKELESMEKAAPGRVFPVLWLLPEMLNSIEDYCTSHFKAFKLHGRLNYWGDEFIDKALDASGKYSLPLLIHTGGDERNDAGFYYRFCCRHPEALIVLAHGRPSVEALKILRECPNTFVDTAFMSLEDIASFLENGFAERMLWGTDYPLCRYFYPRQQPIKWLIRRKEKALRVISREFRPSVFHENFKKLFLS